MPTDIAQETLKGACVYLISYAEIPNHYKIGCTVDLIKRLDILNCACPFEIVLIHTIYTEDAEALEKALHRRFATQRIKREWFTLSQDDIKYIKSIHNSLQIIPPVVEQPNQIIRPQTQEASKDRYNTWLCHLGAQRLEEDRDPGLGFECALKRDLETLKRAGMSEREASEYLLLVIAGIEQCKSEEEAVHLAHETIEFKKQLQEICDLLGIDLVTGVSLLKG
jgi:hypothetical protein